MTGTAAAIGRLPDPAGCNALTETAAGLLVPEVLIEVDPGLAVTPPAAGDCPQVWRIGVDAAWVQNATLTFNHALTGADRVWEKVSEVPTLTIPRAGVWAMDYNARGAVSVPTAAAQYVMTGIYKNGALIVGTEALIVGIAAANGAQATGGLSFLHPFNAGDTVELWAFRVGQAGASAVVSNPDGRTRITGHWIAPVGDGPS
ncbi:hypothetical protein F5972_08140 [Microbispora cellulosiformans]|uniref:Uncharacterized protein n=1 Tax=Microbispora cellulosiformans TaxID=2614688 RepID=A0A5J5K535_9ACTN|nr:hypothetical protein [Microbispora cellulosiformans]KAA9379616.1 hypothetical protein F5972_08140 [Microbispora cellulosiformans]